MTESLARVHFAWDGDQTCCRAIGYGVANDLLAEVTVELSGSALEAIRANRNQAGSYNMAKTCATPSAGSTLVTNDQAAWIAALKATIGSGASDDSTCGQISNCDVNNATNCTITVFWNDTRAGGASDRSISVESRI